MQAVTCDVILSSVRTRVDSSLGLSLSTPHLEPDEMLVFLQLKQQNLKMLLQPMDEPADGLTTVKTNLETKTPSQRLRSVLYLVWKQQGNGMDFPLFYSTHMEKLIDDHKKMLEPEF